MLIAAYGGSVGPKRPEEFGVLRVLPFVEPPHMDEVGHNPVNVPEGGNTKWFISFLGCWSYVNASETKTTRLKLEQIAHGGSHGNLMQG